MNEYPDGFAGLLVALNSSLVDEEGLSDTLRRVAFIACQSPIGADNAGVTLQRDGGPATAAFHGDAALPLDQAQYEADDGPCLHAYRTGEIVRIADIENFGRWPKFAAAAAEAGIVSSLSLPMMLRSKIVGALNLYASTAMHYTDERVHLAELFAEQAALAVTNADVYWKTFTLTENLTIALENRERIGQAKGVLATREHITMDEAFEQLRRTSQDLNIKLREVADYVAQVGELPKGAQDTRREERT